MERSNLVYLGALVAAALTAAACGKKEGATVKVAAPIPVADAALVDTVAAQPSVALPNGAPAWTQESPHFFVRNGRKLASAVGWSRSANPGLGRSAAEDAARADLLRLIRGGGPAVGLAEGDLPGAVATDVYASQQDGLFYVRVEVEVKP